MADSTIRVVLEDGSSGGIGGGGATPSSGGKKPAAAGGLMQGLGMVGAASPLMRTLKYAVAGAFAMSGMIAIFLGIYEILKNGLAPALKFIGAILKVLSLFLLPVAMLMIYLLKPFMQLAATALKAWLTGTKDVNEGIEGAVGDSPLRAFFALIAGVFVGATVLGWISAGMAIVAAAVSSFFVTIAITLGMLQVPNWLIVLAAAAIILLFIGIVEGLQRMRDRMELIQTRFGVSGIDAFFIGLLADINHLISQFGPIIMRFFMGLQKGLAGIFVWVGGQFSGIPGMGGIAEWFKGLAQGIDETTARQEEQIQAQIALSNWTYQQTRATADVTTSLLAEAKVMREQFDAALLEVKESNNFTIALASASIQTDQFTTTLVNAAKTLEAIFVPPSGDVGGVGGGPTQVGEGYQPGDYLGSIGGGKIGEYYDPTREGGIRYGEPKQFGGIIPNTGMYLMHAGEEVTTRSAAGGGGGGGGNITVNLTGPVFGSREGMRELIQDISRELQLQLRGRVSYGRGA